MLLTTRGFKGNSEDLLVLAPSRLSNEDVFAACICHRKLENEWMREQGRISSKTELMEFVGKRAELMR